MQSFGRPKQRGKRNGITVIQRIPIHKIIIIIYFNITQIRTHTHRIISLCEESIYGILSYWIWAVMIRSLDLQTQQSLSSNGNISKRYLNFWNVIVVCRICLLNNLIWIRIGTYTLEWTSIHCDPFMAWTKV